MSQVENQTPLDPMIMQRLCVTQAAYISKLEAQLQNTSAQLDIAEQRAGLLNTAHDYIRNALRLLPDQPLRFDYYAQQITALMAEKRAAAQREAQQREQLTALRDRVQRLERVNQSHTQFRGEVAKLMRQQELFEAGLNKK